MSASPPSRHGVKLQSDLPPKTPVGGLRDGSAGASHLLDTLDRRTTPASDNGPPATPKTPIASNISTLNVTHGISNELAGKDQAAESFPENLETSAANASIPVDHESRLPSRNAPRSMSSTPNNFAVDTVGASMRQVSSMSRPETAKSQKSQRGTTANLSSRPSSSSRAAIERSMAIDMLFPGWRFTPSPNADQQGEGFGYAGNESKPVVNPLTSLTDKEKKEYERAVLKKYLKHGMLSTFKGKEEMKIAEAKVVAKKEIERVHEAVQAKEKELILMEEKLVHARAVYSQSFVELQRLAGELKKIIRETQAWEIDKRLPGAERARKMTRGKDDNRPLSPLIMPDDPVLLLNRRYGILREQYLENEAASIKAADLIPRLEAAVIPVQHELSALQLQADRLRELEELQMDAEMRELNEMQVVTKYRMLQGKRKLRAARRHAEKVAEMKRRQEEEEKMLAEEREAKLRIQRQKLRVRLKQTVEEIQEKRKEKQAEEHEAEVRKHRALTELGHRVAKIRQNIAETSANKRHLSEYAVDGSTDSLLISQTKDEIRLKMARDNEQKNAAARKREKQKMDILLRLIEEEDERKRKERAERREKEHQKEIEERLHGGKRRDWEGMKRKELESSNFPSKPVEDSRKPVKNPQLERIWSNSVGSTTDADMIKEADVAPAESVPLQAEMSA
ncbi:hypothetical protein HK104_000574, partial [Borealophlyctis nickersoniae]